MALIKYRPEIDGLRTIAILAVIIYHADFFYEQHHIFQGGFFGVDIFFVISGFLITSLITKELNTTGKFSFLNFYDKRARRLLPVLTFIIIFVFPFAWTLLLPASFIDFAKSIIASNVFLSNFYWYESLQVYGAEASSLKPFLHTWSLAIEEQYYFIFPIILIAAIRWLKINVIAILTIITLVSLQFAEVVSGKEPSFSFYLLPSRFWELLIGSLLAYTLHIHPAKENDTLLTKTMPSIGLYLIIYSIIFVDFDSNHPGFITLLPIIGTVLIIWFSNKDELVTKILSSKLLVSVGLISYSLYLWHYPIFAFLRIEDLFDSFQMKLYAIIGVLLLSVISYKLIEQPFRSKIKISSKYFYSFIILSALAILTICSFIIKNDGYPERFKGIASGAKEMKEYRSKYWGTTSAYKKIEDFKKDNFSVEVIGNSWAQDIANSLIENSNYEISFRGMTGHLCKAITLNSLTPQDKNFNKMQEHCIKGNLKRFQTKLPNTNLVIIGDNSWMAKVNQKEISEEVLKNIKILRNYGYQGPIMIISNRPKYKKAVFNILKEYGATGDGANKYAKKYLILSTEQDAIAKKFYHENKIYYYSLNDSLCFEGTCKIVYQGMPLYHDGSHLTLSGAKYVGTDLVKYIDKNIRITKPIY